MASADKPSPRWIQRVEEHTGRVCLAAVLVRDQEWATRRRWSFTSHGAVFLIGVLLMTTLGPGWVLVPLATVAHQFVYEPKRLLVATATGLEVVELRARSVETVAQIPVGSSAEMTLRPDQPQVRLAILQQTRLAGQEDAAPPVLAEPELAEPALDESALAEGVPTEEALAEPVPAEPALAEGAPPAEVPLWEGTVSGNDLKLAEEIIRAGGGEPVRITQ